MVSSVRLAATSCLAVDASRPSVLLVKNALMGHPERLERFFAMQNHVRLGQYLFVHAGIHPDLGLAMLKRDWSKRPSRWVEEDEDPLWIRGPFLTYEGAHEEGVVVIHGHTPRPDVELRANRINIDTRAYDTGRLTAVQLQGSKLRFIQSVGVVPPPR